MPGFYGWSSRNIFLNVQPRLNCTTHTLKMAETGPGMLKSDKKGMSELSSSNTQDGGKTFGTGEDGKQLS
jgi:hypothetical protein